MPVSDLDITRSAHLWIQKYGEQATTRAREMVEKMRRRGDKDGARCGCESSRRSER